MKVFIDANVLFSAAVFPGGAASQAYDLALEHDAIVSDFVLGELRRVVSEKVPDKLEAMERFIIELTAGAETISTPKSPDHLEHNVRDVNDRPVLRAARAAGSDILLTGDKGFNESGITEPEPLTPRQFLDRYR
ncbi:MAG: putative toxin-antitoxin system toxin component, PIN family [Promicromonosporaceae bacterium]|nr:putative toxin-antitoxin system toxin component, PIN family [Promicromonosporaceae bacterium]